jgi:hypothetical protein
MISRVVMGGGFQVGKVRFSREIKVGWESVGDIGIYPF